MVRLCLRARASWIVLSLLGAPFSPIDSLAGQESADRSREAPPPKPREDVLEEEPPVVHMRPSIEAVRVDEPPDIDGRLDDPVWELAPAAGPLYQYEPLEGDEMSEQTEFRFVYDDEALYIGVWCFDSEPDKILARVMARDDRITDDDSIIVVLDPFLDHRNGYMFMVNPNGARLDALITDNTNINSDWDGIWRARASIDEEGWKAEIEIPFKSLSFDPDSDTWGFNLSRGVKRKSERGRWSSPRRSIRTYNVGEAGRLTGLRDLQQGVGLDVVPYVLGRWTSDRTRASDDVDNEFGGDIRYRVTPNLTASLSYNTDFAETEVDARQVNLTRFPLFFPEKRDFFLEDAGIFEFANLGRFSRRRTLISGSRPPELLPFFSRRSA